MSGGPVWVARNDADGIILICKILNSSVSTGAGLQSLAYNSTGLQVAVKASNAASPTVYSTAGGTIEDITTLGTYAAPTSGKIRFKRWSDTYHPGIIELHLPVSWWAVSGADFIAVSIMGVTNMVETDFTIALNAIDPKVEKAPASTALSTATWTNTLATNIGTTNTTVATNLDAAISDIPTSTEIIDEFLGRTITKGSAGTIERAFWQSIKINVSIDGTVVDDATNSSSQFFTDLTMVDNKYDHQLLVMVSGSLIGEARPIDSSASTNGVIVLQEALTAEPAASDEFLILPQHVHPVSEIQSGLARTGADGDTLESLSDQIDGIDSGSATVNVLPATGIVADRSAGITLLPVIGETISQAITVYQLDGTTAVNLSGKTLAIIFETMSGADVAVVDNADITVSGASNNVVTFAYPSAVTASERVLRFAIRDAAAPLTMYLQGICSVVAAPQVDA